MYKKAQTEIMGLIVIVVLLTLGMFFTVSFQASQPKKEVKKTYDDEQLSSSFILSFLKTNAECRNYDIEELIADCATEKRIVCEGNSSCKYVNKTLNLFLKETLIKWNKKFNLTIEGIPEENISFEQGCNRDKVSTIHPIVLWPYPGTINIKLDICK